MTQSIANYCNEQKILTDDDFQKLRQYFYKLYIKTNNDTYENGMPHRVIFSAHHKVKQKLINPFHKEANGLIIEFPNCNLLVIPPKTLRYELDASATNNSLKKNLYDIQYIDEGTSISLYWFNSKWCISTTSGYEMNNVQWNNITYQQALDEILKTYNITFDDLKLSKDKCYSFIIKHPNFHPFWEDNKPTYKIVFIQSVVLATGIINKVNDVHDNLSIIRKLECNNVHELFKNAKQAKDPNVKYLFGYILRSDYNIPNLLIESSLLINIRKLAYDNNLKKFSQNNKLDHINSFKLSAYLSRKSHTQFLELFPQYRDDFKYFDSVINKVINRIIQFINDAENKKIEDNNAEDKKVEDKEPTNLTNQEFDPNSQLDICCMGILSSLQNVYQINSKNKSLNMMLADFILHENFMLLLYSLMYPK